MSHKYVKFLLVFGMSTALLTGCQTMDKAQQAATMTDYSSEPTVDSTVTDDTADVDSSNVVDDTANTEDTSDADIATDVTSDVDAGAEAASTEDADAAGGDYYGSDVEVTVDENGVKHAGGFVLYEDGRTSSADSSTAEFDKNGNAVSDESTQSSSEAAEYTQDEAQEITLDNSENASN